MRFLANKDWAIISRYDNTDLQVPYDIDYHMTPYGFAIPSSMSGNLFIRAMRGSIKFTDLKDILASIVVIDHTGEVNLVNIRFGIQSQITLTPISTTRWLAVGLGVNIDSGNIALGHLLEGLTEPEKVIARLEEVTKTGMYLPYVLKTSDIAAKLKELGYTKTLSCCRLETYDN